MKHILIRAVAAALTLGALGSCKKDDADAKPAPEAITGFTGRFEPAESIERVYAQDSTSSSRGVKVAADGSWTHVLPPGPYVVYVLPAYGFQTVLGFQYRLKAGQLRDFGVVQVQESFSCGRTSIQLPGRSRPITNWEVTTTVSGAIADGFRADSARGISSLELHTGPYNGVRAYPISGTATGVYATFRTDSTHVWSTAFGGSGTITVTRYGMNSVNEDHRAYGTYQFTAQPAPGSAATGPMTISGTFGNVGM